MSFIDENIEFSDDGEGGGGGMFLASLFQRTFALKEWDNLTKSFIDTDAKVRRLQCQNEQIDPLLPKGIKLIYRLHLLEEMNDCVAYWCHEFKGKQSRA